MRKHNLLSGCLLLAVQISFATVRTVSNSPTTLAQFNNIQAAVNVSSNGDTIYVHGSPTDYAAFTITDIRLVVIGPGWRPDKNFAFPARVNGMTITGASASNSEIHGIVFYNIINAYTGTHADGLKFFRNEFQSYVYIHGAGTYKDYIFQGNYFNTGMIYASGSSTYQNILIQNNIFYHTSWSLYDFTITNNVLIDHNLFYGPSSGSQPVFAGTCNALTITNNIFVRRNAATSCSTSVFNNNITFNAGTNNPWAVNGNSNAGGNVENLDPQMADQVLINSGTNNPLLNFTIAAGPANNSSNDTPTPKDMGLLFDATGSLNWANSRNSRLPRIFSMNLTNPVIPVNGTLNVEVNARKSN